MSRILLQYVLPLLLPAAVFLVWVLLTRKRSGSKQTAMERLQQGPWYWLVVAGFALMAAGLAYVGLTQGTKPGGSYKAPHYEGGRIVPVGTVKPGAE